MTESGMRSDALRRTLKVTMRLPTRTLTITMRSTGRFSKEARSARTDDTTRSLFLANALSHCKPLIRNACSLRCNADAESVL